MKIRFAIGFAALIFATPALGQTTANQVQPGSIETSGCNPGFLSCFKPYSNSNPLPVTTGSSGSTVTANQGTPNAGGADAAWPVTSTAMAPVAPATATATQSTAIACQYNSSGITPTDGQQFILQCGPKGGLSVGGSVASGATDAGNPVKTGSKYNASPITVTDGQRVDDQADAHGTKGVGIRDLNGNPVDPTQPVGTYPTPQSSSSAGIAVTTSTALEASGCKVFKASAGNAYELGVVNTDTSQDYLFIFNTTSAPSNGAVTPARPPLIVAANGGYVGWSAGGDPPSYYNTGITACLSSTGGLTLTLVASKGLFTGKVQ